MDGQSDQPAGATAIDQQAQELADALPRKRTKPEDAHDDAAPGAKEPRLQEQQSAASGGSLQAGSPAKTGGDQTASNDEAGAAGGAPGADPTGPVPSKDASASPSPAPPTVSAAATAAPAVAGTTPLSAAYSEDKGCRNTMEDVCVMQLDARPDGHHQQQQLATCRLAHFGIFDGHGGVSCASFAAQHLHTRVLESGLLRKGFSAADGKADAKACKACIVEGYKKTDEALLRECAAKNWQDGACAVTVWVLQDLVLVANVGDAKCVLARLPDKPSGAAPTDSKPKAIVLTKEHTALLERQRIEKAGGTVVNGRLAGRIQIARSFGDAAFKKLGCSSTPDVTAFPLTARDAFLLLGCDGFWGVFGAQEAVDTAQSLFAEGLPPKAVTNRLLNVAVREKRCKDNCSVMLVPFGGAATTASEAS